MKPLKPLITISLLTFVLIGCASIANRPENWKARFPQEKFVQLGPITTRYKVIGSGPPLVLLHGLEWGYDTFRENEYELSKHFTVYMFDQRGMGFSSRPPGYEYSIYTQFQHTMEFMKAMNLEHAHILGHSMGGYIALLLAYYQPEKVDKLIVIDVPYRQRGFPSPIVDIYAKTFIGKWFEWFPLWLATRAILLDVYENDDKFVTSMRISQAHSVITLPGAGAALRSYIRSINFEEAAYVETNYFPKIKAPTLILWGEKDKWFHPYLGEKLASTIPGSKFVKIYGAGHMSMEEKPREVNAEIIKFFKG